MVLHGTAAALSREMELCQEVVLAGTGHPMSASSRSPSDLVAGKSPLLQVLANSLSSNDAAQAVVPCSDWVPNCRHTQLSSPFLWLFLRTEGEDIAGQSLLFLLV